MSFREYLQKLDTQKHLLHVRQAISKDYEIAGLLKRTEPSPVIFENVGGSAFPVIGNLLCSKSAFAEYFGIKVPDIIPFLSTAIQNRSRPQVVAAAACQEVVEVEPDLDSLPLLLHCEADGGRYISSGVVLARHPVHGQNADFHRCMQFSKTELAVRVVRNRHFDRFLREQGSMDVAVCIGNSPSVLAAAATSVDIGIDELEIANAMEPLQVVKATTSDLLVPAEAEFVIEGIVHLAKTHAEGPFVDLTGTYDVVRHEPVLEVRTITHRRDAIWQALLPGALEHKLLMGMPREPTIFRKVNEVVHCLDVNVDPGGCSWLHAIVQIDKQTDGDGKKAIEAAFTGHSSCKHVFVVDKDINIYDPLEVEWAMATRFQGDRDLIVLPRAPGSSLDPSAEAGSQVTTRLGFDLTAPLSADGKSFQRADFPSIDLEHFISDSAKVR